MSNLLAKAIENDNFAEAMRLIKENKNNVINEPDLEGNYPLHLTMNFSLYRNLTLNSQKILNELANALLEQGANPNVKDQWGSYPIHYAAIHGNLELINNMIEYGADYNAEDAAKETPLHQAIRRKHNHVANYILSKSMPKLEETIEGYTVLDYAKRYNNMFLQAIEEKLQSYAYKQKLS